MLPTATSTIRGTCRRCSAATSWYMATPMFRVGVLWEGQPISESRFGFAPPKRGVLIAICFWMERLCCGKNWTAASSINWIWLSFLQKSIDKRFFHCYNILAALNGQKEGDFPAPDSESVMKELKLNAGNYRSMRQAVQGRRGRRGLHGEAGRRGRGDRHLDKVLAILDGDKATFGAPVVEGAKVEAKVVKNGKGKKIRIFGTTPRRVIASVRVIVSLIPRLRSARSPWAKIP